MTAASSEQVSGGLAFATPGDWFPLRVPRERADAEALTGQILAARPDLPREAVARMCLHRIRERDSLDLDYREVQAFIEGVGDRLLENGIVVVTMHIKCSFPARQS